MKLSVIPRKGYRGAMFAMLICTSSFCSGGEQKSYETYYRIPETRIPPQIDGIVDQQEWSDAAVLPNYCGTQRQLSYRPVHTLLKYDKENLYIAFITQMGFDPDPKQLPDENEIIQTADSLSVSFSDDRTEGKQFTFERGGAKYERKWHFAKGIKNYSWNPEWKFKQRISANDYMATNKWEAEVCIPWSSIGIDPQEGTVIRTQFARFFGPANITVNQDEPAGKVITWTPHEHPWGIFGFGGQLELGGSKPAFRFLNYSAFDGGVCGLNGTLTKSGNTQLEYRFLPQNGGSPIFGKKMFPGKKVDAIQDMELESPDFGNFAWVLTDQSGVIARGGFDVTARSSFDVSIAWNHFENKIVFIGDASRIKRSLSNSTAQLSIKDSSGKILSRRDVRFDKGRPVLEERLEVPAGFTGQLTGQAELTDGNGKRIAHAMQEINITESPAWLKFDKGRYASPAPETGWKPVRIEQENGESVFHILRNQYVFSKNSPLPSKLIVSGRDFSTAPIEFRVSGPNGELRFHPDSSKLADCGDMGGTVLWSGTSGELNLDVQCRIEFDGVAYCTAVLKAIDDRPFQLNGLSVVMPLRPEFLRYMRGSNNLVRLGAPTRSAFIASGKLGYELPNPNLTYDWRISGTGWKFEKDFQSYYWLGDRRGGMFFILPSMRDMNIGEKYSDITDRDGEFVFRVNLIDQPVQFEKEARYEFAFALTPSREISRKSELWRVGHSYPEFRVINGKHHSKLPYYVFEKGQESRFFGRNQVNRPFAKDYITATVIHTGTSMIGDPAPDQKELDRIAASVAGIKSSFGGSPMLWYDSLFTTVLRPHIAPYTEDFECLPKMRMQVEKFGGVVCPTETWQNFYLWGASERMRAGITSFYMDMSSLYPCRNRTHHHGYYDQNSQLQPELAFRECREFFLRYQHLVKSNDPKGLLVMHQSSFSPFSLWMDVVTWGEEWCETDTYQALLPEFFQLIHMVTGELGSVSNFYPALASLNYPSGRNSKVTLSEVCGLAFVHGESIFPTKEIMLPGLRMIWESLDRFGVNESGSEWIPYFENSRNCYPGGPIVSSWKRAGRELLVIFNPYYEEKMIPASVFSGIEAVRPLLPEGTESEQLPSKIGARGFLLLEQK